MAALAKTVGAILVILGVMALLVGIAVAGYAFFDYSQARRDMFRDQDREEADMAMMTGGAILAALGLVVFLAGLVTLVASRPKHVRSEAIAPPSTPGGTSSGTGSTAARAAKSPAPPPAPRLSLGVYATSPRGAVVAAVVGILAVFILVAGMVFVRSGGDAFAFNGSPDPPPVTYLDETHNGTVQGGSIGSGVPAFNFGDNGGAFTVPQEADACRLTLDWDPAGPGGAENLRLEVAREGTQVVVGSGGPGFSVDLPTPVFSVRHTFAVFPDGSGTVASQAFSLHVVCVGP